MALDALRAKLEKEHAQWKEVAAKEKRREMEQFAEETRLALKKERDAQLEEYIEKLGMESQRMQSQEKRDFERQRHEWEARAESRLVE